MDENLFSKTFQTSKADEHPTVSARMDGDKVELMKVSKSGFTIVVYAPERSLRYFSGIN